LSVKRKDLVKALEDNGWTLKREGGDHTIYTNGEKRFLFNGTAP